MQKIAVVSLAVLAVSLQQNFIPTQALAQNFFNEDSAQQSSTLIQTPREVERLLNQAKAAIAQSSWSEASKALGLVLGIEAGSNRVEGQGQDYFLNDSGNATQDGRTVHEQARRLFDEFDEAGQATLELRYGVEAKATFEQAVASGDWKTIEQISGRFPMTAAGRLAAFVSAEHQLAIGNPLWAANRFKALIDSKSASKQFGRKLSLMAAMAWQAAGDPDRALSAAGGLNAESTPKTFIYGKDTIFVDDTERVLRIIQNQLANMTTLVDKQAAPRVPGGGPDRNADSFAGIPLPFVSWHSLLHESIQHEDEATRTIRELSKKSDNISLVPSRAAIVVPPYLITMTYDQRIHAIDLRTGQLKWASPFAGVPTTTMERYIDRETGESKLPIHDYLAQRIWGQQATGQLTASDDQIFAVVEQPSINAAQNLVRGVNANIAIPMPKPDHNVLQAYSIDNQASLSWEVGGMTGLAEPRLSGVLFLGPPLPYDGQLLIIGEHNGELLLFSIDPNNGAWLWQQQLAANNNSTIADDNVRRNFACCVAVQAGVVVCPTLSGELVGVDLLTHDLKWATRYAQTNESNRSDQVNVFGSRQATQFKPLLQRSSETSVVIDDGIAVHAAPDGQGIYAVDIYNGKLKWTQPGTDALYIGGIEKGIVVVMSSEFAIALDLQSGEKRWVAELTTFGKVTGRAARNGDQLLIPTSSQKVVQLDMTSGEIRDSLRVERSLGNLIATHDSLISFGPIDVTSYPIREKVRSDLQQDLAADAKPTPLMLVRQAELALSENVLTKAFDLALAAYRDAAEDDNVKGLVRKIALATLRDDFQTFAPRIGELKELMESGPDRGVYLISLIRGLIARQQYDEAVQRLLDLSQLESRTAASFQAGDNAIELQTDWRIEQDQWIAATLARLLPQVSTAAAAGASKRIDKAIDQSLHSLNPALMNDRHATWLPQASPLFLMRAIQYYRGGEFLAAEQAAISAQNLATSKPFSQAATLLQVLIYRDAGRSVAAAQLMTQLGRPIDQIKKLSEADVLNDAVHEKLPDFVAKARQTDDAASQESPLWLNGESNLNSMDDADLQTVVDGAAKWPNASVQVNVIDNASADMQVSAMSCNVRYRIGAALDGWDVRITASGIELVNPTGNDNIAVQLENRPNSTSAVAYIIDSLVIVEVGNELIAIDSLAAQKPLTNEQMVESSQVGIAGTEAVLWNEEFGTKTNAIRNVFNSTTARGSDKWDWGAEHTKNYSGFSAIPADHFGLVIATDKTVRCIDYRSGSIIWTVGYGLLNKSFTGGTDGFGSLPWVSYVDAKVVLLDPVSKRRVILDAHDGTVVDKGDLVFKGDIWGVAHGNYLTGERTSERTIIFEARSGLTNETIQSATVPNTSRADLLADEAMVIWGPDAKLHFWNLKTGAANQYDLPAEDRFNYLRLQRFENRIVVATYASNMKLEMVENESEDLQTAGPLIAIDAENGKPLWDKPLRVYSYYLPLQQPRITPALTLVRQMSFRWERTNVKTASIAIIDMREGKLIYQNDYLTSLQGLKYNANVSPAEHKLHIDYRASQIDVVWSDEGDSQLQASPTIGKIDLKTLLDNLPPNLLKRIQTQKEIEEASPF